MIQRIKHIFFYLSFLGLVLFSLESVSQTREDTLKQAVKKLPAKVPRNIVKFNPLPILWGPIPLTAEYRILREITVGKQESMQVGVSYLGKSPFVSLAENSYNSGNGPNGTGTGNSNPNGTVSFNTPDLKLTISGFRFQLSYRKYLGNSKAPNGAYISPHLSFSEAFISDKYIVRYQQHVRVTHFNVNFLVGYQSVFWDKFAFEFFTGLGYKRNRWEENSSGVYAPIATDEIPLYNLPIKFTLGFNMGIAFE